MVQFNIWVTFEIPLASMCLYYPRFFSLETHLHHFHLERKREASVWEHKHIFFNQEGSNTYFKAKFYPQPKFWMKKNNKLLQIHILSFHHFSFLPQGILHRTSKHHFNRLPTGSIGSSWLPFHISLKLLNSTWFWIWTSFLVIWHAQLISCIHASNLKFFIKFPV